MLPVQNQYHSITNEYQNQTGHQVNIKMYILLYI